ncbi:MAG TPA: hypothetical protein VGF55_20500 [Gemmataceae bacterium]|jgi:hypothetical protein
MSLPYDAAIKDLVQSYPQDWLAGVGLPAAGPVAVVNVDLSTVTAAADAIFAVGDPPAYYVTFEFQSGRDAGLSRRVLVYNALLHQRFGLPVQSVVVLLRRAANDAALDGTVRYEVRAGLGGMDFRFEVVRVWERPADELLRGAVGMVPLAPLGALPPGLPPEVALAPVVRQLEERLVRETAPSDSARLLTAAFVLTGMRLSADAAAELFQGVRVVEESTTYQWIMEKGAIRHGRKMLLAQGRVKFGEPDAATRARIEAIDNLDQMDRLIERLILVNSWQELFEGT